MIIADVNKLEREVYDKYPILVRALIHSSAAMAKAPYEAMLDAIEKMRVTQAFIGPLGTEPVQVEILDEHEELIRAAMAYRNTYVSLALRSASRDDD